MLNRMPHGEHPDDSVLLAYLDCEQSEWEQEKVREHLLACWTCRARFAKLEDTIAAFVDFRERAFSVDSAQPPDAFRGFSARLARVVDEPAPEGWRSWRLTIAAAMTRLRGRASSLRLPAWSFQPSRVLPVAVVISIFILLPFVQTDKIPSATSLLAQSAWAERLDRSQVVRRTVVVERKDAATGRVISRRRVESWKSGAGATARRVYDESNAVVDASWVRSDGTRVASQGKTTPTAGTAETLPGGESVWELTPSASEFGRMVGPGAELLVTATPANYVVDYDAGSAATSRLRRASLTLRRGDLHAVRQVFVIEEHSTASEYLIEEVGYERRSLLASDFKFLEPEAEPQSLAAAVPPAIVAPAVRATLRQELQLFLALDRVGALVGEQIEVSRLPSGELRLHGLVATPVRRQEIVQSLGALATDPAAKIELSTLDEVQDRQHQATPSRLRMDHIEIAQTEFPVEAEVRAYLQRMGVPDREVSSELYRISTGAMDRAAAVRDHALALQRLAAQFTRTQVDELGDDDRQAWSRMVQRHAAGFARGLEKMRAELLPVLEVDPVKQAGTRPLGTQDVWDCVRELDTMAATINEGISRSFAVRAGVPSGTAPVKQGEFWELVSTAIAVAESIPVNLRNR